MALLSPSPALRAGLRALLSGEAGLSVAGAGARQEDLADSLDQAGVVVATAGGMDLAGEGLSPDQALLWITDEVDEALIETLAGLDLRAWGILPPEATAEMLQAAVRALAEGLIVVPPELLGSLRGSPRGVGAQGARPAIPAEDEGVEPLTARELDVLRLLAQGLTNKQIALALGISEHTVKYHVSAIYGKLAVSNRAEAVRKGAHQGWVAL